MASTDCNKIMKNTEESNRTKNHLLRAVNLVAPEHRSRLPEYFQYLRKVLSGAGELKTSNGYWLAPGFEPDTAKYAYDELEVNSGDVLVATYSKTGTTWVSTTIKHIFGRKDPELLKKYMDVSHFYYYLEYGPVSKYEVTENLPFERRVFGTHLPVSLINLTKYRKKGVKVVYIIRNPKDQAVSWYNFIMSHPTSKSKNWKHVLPKDENLFYDFYIEGKQLLFAKKNEGYLEHIRAWYEHKNDENVLYMVYEKIKENPRVEIRKLAEFIGEYPSEEELDWIVEKTSFSSMKKKAQQIGMTQRGATHFFRKGDIGDWRNHLTEAQSKRIDQKVEQILGDTDIKFIYDGNITDSEEKQKSDTPNQILSNL